MVCKACHVDHPGHRACRPADLAAARGWTLPPDVSPKHDHASCPKCAEHERTIADLRAQLQAQKPREPKDRKTYMRDLMRKRRADKRAAHV